LNKFVILAELTVAPERLQEFVEHSLADGRQSVENEPGCRQFEVHVMADGSPTVVLYEVYDDRAAFEAHLKTPHFFRWRDATQSWITDRRVSFLHRRR
jgi:quinol monooxygenase YgiN